MWILFLHLTEFFVSLSQSSERTRSIFSPHEHLNERDNLKTWADVNKEIQMFIGEIQMPSRSYVYTLCG